MVRPQGVMRGSSSLLSLGPWASASWYMERSLMIQKVRPSLPRRSWVKKIGPLEPTAIIVMENNRNGADSNKRRAATTISKTRLIKATCGLISSRLTSMSDRPRLSIRTCPEMMLNTFGRTWIRTLTFSMVLIIRAIRSLLPEGMAIMTSSKMLSLSKSVNWAAVPR